MKKPTRSLLLAVVVSAMLLLVHASQDEPIAALRVIQMRALLPTSTSSSESSTAAPTSTQASTSAAASSSSVPQATTSSSPSATSKSDTATSAANTTPAAASASQASSSTPEPVATSAVATTDSSGQVVTSYIQYTPTPSNISPSPSQASNDSSGGGGGGGGLSTGSIVGLSVSGGIAALGIILFFVWKFTRKRFADFDDTEAIKWPELNAHNNDVHALPTHSTGRAGFGPENDSDVNLTRAPSPGAYANSISAASVPEGYAAGDPYAVPPLPHLNPNQPYRDEPGFYDPYRGPVPNTFSENMSDGHVESIPMTQMAAGMRSPGPQMPYDMQGRSSPAPQAAMGYPSMEERSRTPNLSALGAGRNSPSPHPGYAYGPR